MDWFFLGACAAAILGERYLPEKRYTFQKKQIPQILFWVWFSGFVFSEDNAWVLALTSGPARFLAGLNSPSDWSVGQIVLAYVVVREFFSYALHRLFHSVPFFWAFHKVHHNIHEMHWGSNFRQHMVEQILYMVVVTCTFQLYKIDTTALWYLNAFQLTFGMLQHSNIHVRLGPLDYFLNSPHAHRWHHATHTEFHGGQNFGAMTSIFDRLFGTYYAPKEIPKEIGFPGMKNFAASVPGQVVGSFLDSVGLLRMKWSKRLVGFLDQSPV
jgi:sterol desaturase/sphingolipid hydroxylase (fatty acid hydroxylase superfamily)